MADPTLSVMELASMLCSEDEDKEFKERGILLPCRKISPLDPPLRMEEYQMMERDRGKYLLYWTAIAEAIRDIVSNTNKEGVGTNRGSSQGSTASDDRTTVSRSVTCLVFGAGLGRLVQYCIDAVTQYMQCTKYNTSGKVVGTASSCHQVLGQIAADSGVLGRIAADPGIPEAHIHAVDANPLAVECLKEYFSSEDYSSQGIVITVHPAFRLFPGMQQEDLPHNLCKIYRDCDLVVSELLGCFGCDEFLPELTSTLCNLFLKDGSSVCIPRDWTTYIAPIQSDCLYKALSSKEPSTYTVGMPGDCIFMSQPRILWKGSCEQYQTPRCDRDGVEFKFTPFTLNDCKKPHPQLINYTIHGLIGYFTSCLYSDVVIDTRHTSQYRNSYHWECFYMPLKEPLLIPVMNVDDFRLLVSVNRDCNILKPLSGRVWSTAPSGCLEKGVSLVLRYSWKVKLVTMDKNRAVSLQQEQNVVGNAISITNSC